MRISLVQALTVTEEVVINSTRFFRKYPSVPSGTEADVDKILIDVYGEARLLTEVLNNKNEISGISPEIKDDENRLEAPEGIDRKSTRLNSSH